MAEERRSVRLEKLPVGLIRDTQRLFDGIVREFQLIDIGRQGGLAVSTSLEVLAYQIIDIGSIRDVLSGESSRAVADGRESIDVQVWLRPDAPEFVGHLGELLRQVDAVANTGALLIGPVDPPLLQFFDWLTVEIRAQMQYGAPPRPYPG